MSATQGNTRAAIVLALGIATAGYLIGDALIRARSSERKVSVRGLAEREVPASLALWPIVFAVTSNDLGSLQQKADAGLATVRVVTTVEYYPGD
ncbi:MAG: hypothetical protein OEW88_01255 [Gammaproteobacteria bacterium]|nr:hypothetical protein [Gammaproteobacteria bacterium]MDH5275029.1 hypothetical protein [Gammaproteobacteria bacterium]